MGVRRDISRVAPSRFEGRIGPALRCTEVAIGGGGAENCTLRLVELLRMEDGLGEWFRGNALLAVVR